MKRLRMIRALLLILLYLIVCPAEGDCQASKRKYELQSDMPYLETYLQQLPSSQINDVFEDDEGFIWVSTKNGVARYDGIGYTLYGDVPGVRDRNGNEYTRLMENEDKTGILAMDRYKDNYININKITHHIDTLYYHEPDGRRESHKHAYAQYTVQYNDSLILTCWSKILRMVRKRDGEIICTDTLSSERGLRINSCSSGVYLVTNGKLHKILYNNGKIELKPLPLPSFGVVLSTYGLSHNELYIVSIAHKDRTNFDFYRVNLENWKVTYDFSTQLSPKGVVEMDDGVWIGTNRELLFYSYATKDISHFTVQNSQLQNPHITAVYKSKRQPIVWIGTQDGLVKNDYYSSKFSYYDIYEWSNIEDGDSYGVVKDSRGGYWLSSGRKAYWKKPGESKFQEVELPRGKDQTARIDIVENLENGMMYLCSSSYIFEFDFQTEKLRTLHHLGARVTSASSYILGQNLVWVEPQAKLCMFDLETNTSKTKTIEIFDGKQAQSISRLATDGDSLVWLITDKRNLSKYNIKTGELINYLGFSEQTEPNPSFFYSTLRVLYRHGQRELWLLGIDGLYYYLPERDKLTKVEYSPFFSSSVRALEVDEQQNVWLGSEYGISCINNTDGRVYEYSNQAYKLPRDFQSGGARISSDGHIIMTGRSSFVEFSIDNFASNDYFPMPKVMQYQYMDAKSAEYDAMTSSWNDIMVDSVITVPAGVRSLSLNIRVLNYSKSEYNTIEWRKEGETEWRVNYTMIPLMVTNLKPGITTLEMRTLPTYTNELVDMPIAKLYINKEVYLHEEVWFKVVVWAGVLAVLITVFFARVRVQERLRLKLQAEVDRQTNELQLAYANLSESQKRVEKQNLELTELSTSLESQVKERTIELEREKSRIEEGSKLKSVFLANLSHEVRTPMNCIVGFAKLLADPTTTKEESVEFVHLIKESANSLLALLGDLLDVSRIESGQMRVNFSPFPVMKDLNDIYKMLLIEKKKVKVEFQLNVSSSVSDVVLNSDRDRFKQIIINLVYNAFKFTEEGHVAINANVVEPEDLRQFEYPATFPQPAWKEILLMSVEDTGIGMPEDKLDVIFEPFRKLNNNKTLYPGLGLGLNICKNLIQLLGGQIWVKSVENMGTTFFFYLPIPPKEE